MNLTLGDVLRARERIRTICINTKLIYSADFSKEYGNDIYIKPENLQITGAFKLRGALNKISKLTEIERKKGLIAASAGNHAQGVAYAANRLGIAATIVMPETTPIIKVEATRKYGVEVILEGYCYDEAYKKAMELKEEKNYEFIHPFDDIEVMAGQGTIGLEILEELKDVDVILVPIGGGGLISGISVAIKSINSNVRVIGVEPEGAKAMKLSIDKGELVSLSTVNTIADGSAVKKPSNLAFKIVQKYVDEIITVEDYELAEAIYNLAKKHKLVVEATGALTIAALKNLKCKNSKIVSLISGGNIEIKSSIIAENQNSPSKCFSLSYI